MLTSGPIGVFDSGYGGLTVLSEFQKQLPEYDFCYLGDNSRAPYGSRSFDIVYQFTREAVFELFQRGCSLVILACNTASAKALRTIQQKDLPLIAPDKRVLGVIRPTVEAVGTISKSRHVAILGTQGTIQSNSYTIEINKLYPDIKVVGEACPMWVPLVENLEYDKPGADYFVKQHINRVFEKDKNIDTVVLGCTHYPLLIDKIRQYIPQEVRLVAQGSYVAKSLKDYLYRHPELDAYCTKGGQTQYFTTESAEKFTGAAEVFLNTKISVSHISLG